MNVNITFLGGSGTVTGSKYLVRYNGKSLLVDCGLFQGYKHLFGGVKGVYLPLQSKLQLRIRLEL